ncbi:MAG: NYN domain-containing protein [Tepidisphaeraceae bacterium]
MAELNQSGPAVFPASVVLPTSILIIDGTNIEARCREAFSRDDIDFGRFFAKVAAATTLLHTHYFTAPFSRRSDPQRLAEQSGRFNVLKAMPNATLHLGRYQAREVRCRECGHVYTAFAEKGTDVAAAVCLIDAAIRRRAEQLFLLAGDNDYLPAVRLARAEGVKVVVGSVISPHEHKHGQLMAIADLRHNCGRYFEIDQDFMADCWRPPKPG